MPNLDFHGLFDASPNPYLVLDRDLNIVGANKAYLAATKRELRDIVGRWAWDAFPTDPDTLKQSIASFQRVIRTGQPDTMALLRFDIPRPEAEGGGFEVRYWSIVHSPVVNPAGEVELVLQHPIDVTDLHRLREAVQHREPGSPGALAPALSGMVERARSVHDANLLLREEIRARRQAERALQESERRLAIALATNGSAVWEMDVATGMVRGEDLLYAMLGYARGELAALSDWIALVHPDDRQALADLVEATIRGERDEYRFEARLRTQDGGWRWNLSQAAVAGRDDQGRAVRLVGTHTDIDKRKRAEAEIRRLNAELEERIRERTADLEQSNEILLQTNMELRNFAHAAAHDLQTPLRSIASFAQLLQQAALGRGDETMRAWSALVVDNTRRLHSLIQNLLAYTRLDSQGLPFEAVDLEEVLDEVIASLAVLIQETGAEISRNPLPAIMADRVQIAQVFQNLIENGLKYNRSKPPRVSVSCRREGGEWIFSVADNGLGVDSRHHQRIFEIFRRLHAYHEIPGTGIGLALCRRIVERHGGRIWVESAAGSGSAFHIALPASRG